MKWKKRTPDVFKHPAAGSGRWSSYGRAGRTVDFRNTVVIMTSNLGSDLIQERFGELDYGHMKELVMGRGEP
ncbi:chaperone protein ClpB [Enterobacter cancerogenus]|uniref:Chaperone protein ClpB n=1 Tax=Enterobacter cancerogenus TaxID=69218 RepID=A0A484Z854_9ENTR|nr:chaperone protein ClpB [Enterobacter cancerogenus]